MKTTVKYVRKVRLPQLPGCSLQLQHIGPQAVIKYFSERRTEFKPFFNNSLVRICKASKNMSPFHANVYFLCHLKTSVNVIFIAPENVRNQRLSDIFKGYRNEVFCFRAYRKGTLASNAL